MTRGRKGGVKRGENSLASNQIPKCSPQPGAPREIQSYVENREERHRSELEEKRKGQKGSEK